MGAFSSIAGRTLRVGLISPYTGSNLGDQAIHISCIENLRSRCPDVAFTAICLNPARVAALHEIAAFPITGLLVPFYSAGSRPRATHRRLLRDSVRALLNHFRALRHAVAWLTRAWRLVGTLDAVVVAGGGQIDDEWGGALGHPWSLFCWALLSRLRGKPFLVLSVGFCRAESALSRRLLRRALNMSAYLSARDEDSVAAIDSLVGWSQAQFVPDLACGLPLLRKYRDFRDQESQTGNRRAPLIVVSPIAYGRGGSWPTEHEDMYRRYVVELASFTSELLARGYRLRILITSRPDDPAIDDLVAAMRRATGPGIEQHTDFLEIFRPETVESLCALLADADCVVVSRLHGVMLSQLLMRPVVAISFDRKVNAQMGQSQQESFLTQIQTVTREELRALFDNLTESRVQVRERLQRWLEASDLAVRGQFDAVARLL